MGFNTEEGKCVHTSIFFVCKNSWGMRERMINVHRRESIHVITGVLSFTTQVCVQYTMYILELMGERQQCIELWYVVL